MASWVSRARELARAPPLLLEPGEDLARLLHALLPRRAGGGADFAMMSPPSDGLFLSRRIEAHKGA